jgi:hypothetical protein
VGQLVSSINSHGASGDPTLIDSTLERQLRIAALVHDVGHVAMSHVVERPLAELDFFERAVAEFNEEQERANPPQLSEIIAYYLIRSTPFRELADKAAHVTRMTPIHPDFCVEIADMIIGKSSVGDMPQVHELISGPFDADKLDYVPRDAKHCGVPGAVDVIRLTQKIRAARVPRNELPRELKERVDITHGTVTAIGIAPSGANTLDEVALGRALMHEKVYGHHKVRAAEAVVAQLVALRSRALEPLNLLAEVLAHGDSEWIQWVASQPTSTLGEKRLAGMLLARALPIRALPLSQRLIAPPREQALKWSKFAVDIDRTPDERSTFVAHVAAETLSLLSALGLDLQELAGAADTVCIENEIFLGGYRGNSADGGATGNEVFLITPDGRVQIDRDALGRAQAWTDAHNTARVFPIVFATRELAPWVSFAVEIVLLREHGFRVDRSESSLAGTRLPHCSEIRAKLHGVGYFDGPLKPLAPQPPILLRADAEDRIDAIFERLRGYQGTQPMEYLGESEEVTNDSIPGLKSTLRRWISSFSEDAAEVAFAALEGVHFLTSKQIGKDFRTFMESDEGAAFQGASVVGLGEPRDGSAAVVLALRSAVQAFNCRIRSLPEALSTPSTPILFVEDFAGTGSSAAAIIGGWFGVGNDLGEARGSLVPVHQDELRQRATAVLWNLGSEHAIDAVRTLCNSVDFNPSVLRYAAETDSLPRITSFAAMPGYKEFIAECKSRAQAHFAAAEPSWNADKVDERLLGYGNDGMLLLFPYNTPTATLTELWRPVSGVHLVGSPFPRLKKDS